MMLELGALALVAFSGGWMAWRMGGRAIVKPAMTFSRPPGSSSKAGWTYASRRHGAASHELMPIAVGFNRMAESVQSHQAALEAELASSQAARERLNDAQPWAHRLLAD